jgi:hypothetical protein
VYSKLQHFIHFVFAMVICFASVQLTPAQTTAPVPAPVQPTTTAILRGHIADPTGALIPGAKITLTNALGVAVKSTTADALGHYELNGIAPGSYIVQAVVDGFAPFTSPAIQLAAGQVKRVIISMAIQAEQQSVTVTDEEGPTVSVDAGSNSDSIVLKDKDLDALSDDPDELSNELSALAGPSAGPNGGQIYIDGFTGGTLPPKSAIREIRINQNPFSSEFDRLGYGRIEILTKPGTDVLHGRFFGQGNDDAFNTGNPFTGTIPAYHSIQYNGSVSGALSKKASFFFSVEGRNNQNASIYSADTALLDSDTGLYVPTPVSGGLFNPSTHFEVSPRLDLQLGEKNTLTVRYQYARNSSSGNLSSSTSLPTQSYSSTSSENVIQMSDSQVINDHIVNETRFQYRRGLSSTTSVNTTPTVSVSGEFTGGGYTSQKSTDHTDHLELQNVTTTSVGTQAIKFGVWMRDNRDANTTDANFNGSFTFPSLTAYVDTLNGLAAGETFAQIAAACPSTQTGGCLPTKLGYTTGKEAFLGNVFDAAVFFQDDWKVNRNLTLSGGLRWESQNHTADHDDWGPRVAFAYALDGHKDRKQAKTVLRGGYGFFYDRFQTSSLMSLERYNGGTNSQTQTVITNPTCYTTTSLSAITLSTCGTGSAVTPQIYQIKPDYHSPYTEQLGASLERQLTKTTTLTLTYLRSFGVHQMATINANPYKAIQGTTIYNSTTGSRLNTNEGIVDEFYPEAVFKQNQLIVNVNARFTPNFSIMGFYNVTSAHSNTGTASNSYDLNQSYGRASFASPQMLFLMGNYTGPWAITFNPFLIAQSGKPYNITTNNDLTGDNFFNNRPSYASASSIASNVVQTSFGALDTVPQTGEALIPMNMATGPAAVAINLRVGRSIGIGPKTASANTASGGGPGGPPPGGGGHGGGPGGFGFGAMGGRGGGRGGISNTGHKYSLNFSVQALNLFNNIDYGTPSGSLIPTLNSSTGLYGPGSRFGKSTSLAGGIFSSGSAARRIFFQAAFAF